MISMSRYMQYVFLPADLDPFLVPPLRFLAFPCPATEKISPHPYLDYWIGFENIKVWLFEGPKFRLLMIILEKNPSIQIVLMFTLLGVLLTSVTSPLHTLPSHLEEEQPVTSHYDYELVTSHREEQPVNSCCQSNHNTFLQIFHQLSAAQLTKRFPESWGRRQIRWKRPAPCLGVLG